MTSVAQARSIALSMPDAEESAHHGHPDFRVRGRIFATLWPEQRHAVLKLATADQAALVLLDPGAFSLAGWSNQGWLRVDLRRVRVTQFRELIAAAWRNVAPRQMVAELDAGRSAPRARVQPVEFSHEVAALLRASGLPSDDAGAPQVHLLGCRQSRRLAGVVGLELYGSVGLLRSLAVADTSRGRGLGQALVARAERVAARNGVRTLYLLTTSAADFFRRLGYAPAPRDSAPAAIAATTQFTGVCPASAAFLSKPLRLPAAPNRRTLRT